MCRKPSAKVKGIPWVVLRFFDRKFYDTLNYSGVWTRSWLLLEVLLNWGYHTDCTGDGFKCFLTEVGSMLTERIQYVTWNLKRTKNINLSKWNGGLARESTPNPLNWDLGIIGKFGNRSMESHFFLLMEICEKKAAVPLWAMGDPPNGLNATAKFAL